MYSLYRAFPGPMALIAISLSASSLAAAAFAFGGGGTGGAIAMAPTLLAGTILVSLESELDGGEGGGSGGAAFGAGGFGGGGTPPNFAPELEEASEALPAPALAFAALAHTSCTLRSPLGSEGSPSSTSSCGLDGSHAIAAFATGPGGSL